jgi:hypothetical protein
MDAAVDQFASATKRFMFGSETFGPGRLTVTRSSPSVLIGNSIGHFTPPLSYDIGPSQRTRKPKLLGQYPKARRRRARQQILSTA